MNDIITEIPNIAITVDVDIVDRKMSIQNKNEGSTQATQPAKPSSNGETLPKPYVPPVLLKQKKIRKLIAS